MKFSFDVHLFINICPTSVKKLFLLGKVSSRLSHLHGWYYFWTLVFLYYYILFCPKILLGICMSILVFYSMHFISHFTEKLLFSNILSVVMIFVR